MSKSRKGEKNEGKSRGFQLRYTADPTKTKTRKCLHCDNDFLSTWAGNRICPRCAPIVNRMDSQDFTSFGND